MDITRRHVGQSIARSGKKTTSRAGHATPQKHGMRSRRNMSNVLSTRQMLSRSIVILQREPYRDLIAYIGSQLRTDPDYRRIHQWTIDEMVRRILRHEGINLSYLDADCAFLVEEAFKQMERNSRRFTAQH